tara:strand:- start:1103 stop:2443 length:1341 start_codon:yes stop_codon:yes gene_type:complete
MEILIKASQLILSLSILVVLHELGHFIPAKLFKTRVEKFYLFFDPWFSLVKKTFRGTEYGIGWLPLGGYVKISGMIDESMDKEQMKKDPEPWEFRAKPAWQRLIIMLGGVTVNFLLGVFIYSMILFYWGDKYLPNKSVINGVACSDFAKNIGFENKDKIVSIDGVKVNKFSSLFYNVNEDFFMRDDPFNVIVNRSGKEVTLNIKKGIIGEWIKSDEGKARRSFLSANCILTIDSIIPNGKASYSDLKKGDIIFSVEKNIVRCLSDLQYFLSENDEKKVSFSVIRSLDTINNVFCEVDEKGKIGVSTSDNLVRETSKYGFFSSFYFGYKLTSQKLNIYISQFAMIFNSDNGLIGEIGGFGAIGSMFPSSWSWRAFWSLTAFLSLILAFMNLLPIPALDGGHVMFLLYEIVVGKPAPEKFMERAQMVGMVLLLGLLVYANGLDIYKLF